jgi:hypothetical protein
MHNSRVQLPVGNDALLSQLHVYHAFDRQLVARDHVRRTIEEETTYEVPVACFREAVNS